MKSLLRFHQREGGRQARYVKELNYRERTKEQTARGSQDWPAGADLQFSCPIERGPRYVVNDGVEVPLQ